MDQDTSSIEAVLEIVGASLGQPADHHPRTDTLNQIEVTPDVSRNPCHASDVGTRLAQGSAADLDALGKDFGIFSNQRRPALAESAKQNHMTCTKRKREVPVGESEQQMNHALNICRSHKSQSGDLMPPPPAWSRQPYSCRLQIPEIKVRGILRQNENGEADMLQSQGSPFTPARRSHTSSLAHELNNPTRHQPAAPAATFNDLHNQARDIMSTSPRHISVAATLPPGSALPRQLVRAYDAQHKESQGLSSTAVTSRNRTPWSNTRRYGLGSSLGLSNNARIRRRQPSRSPASAGYHRQRLGEGPSASPYFALRGSSNGVSRSPGLADRRVYPTPESNRFSTQLYRKGSHTSNATTFNEPRTPGPFYRDRNFLVEQNKQVEAHNDGALPVPVSSDMGTLAGSRIPSAGHHSTNIAGSGDVCTAPDHGKPLAPSPWTLHPHRFGPSEERILAADPQVSAFRRRAHR